MALNGGFSSASYWEQRYRNGRHSGRGSFGRLAQFKAEVVNGFILENQVNSVIEYGCGDGNQLSLYKIPHYLGVDVSSAAVTACAQKFASDANKRFVQYDQVTNDSADLAMSLDVIYHLVEDNVFEDYLRCLFRAARRFVMIYSSNFDATTTATHVRHRAFTHYIGQHFSDWVQVAHIPNLYPESRYPTEGSDADFFIYGRKCL